MNVTETRVAYPAIRRQAILSKCKAKGIDSYDARFR